MTVTIVGAGMAGLLAANMLRHHDPVVVEAQQQLPNNHSAVLRFRTSVVSDVLGIPFKQVTMIKTAIPWRNPVADALAYSRKVLGEYRSDRSILGGEVIAAERYVAPPDLIARMAARLPPETIRFGESFEAPSVNLAPVISTIPMPDLMAALDYEPAIDFKYVAGFNVVARVVFKCEAYVSLMVPDPMLPYSRVSLTGDKLIVECHGTTAPSNDVAGRAARLLGIDPHAVVDAAVVPQRYAKISPVDNDARKAFMHAATTQYNVYSLGRYATWRPGLLLDDLVQDVRLIDRWISQNNKYDLSRRK